MKDSFQWMPDRTAERRGEVRIKMLARPQKLALIDPSPGSGVITGALSHPL
jgi:hypothetical protein